MGFFSKLFKKSTTTQSTATASELFRDLMTQASAKSGVPINWKTALQLSTAQACARVIAEDIAQIPFKLYQSRQGGGSDPANNHPIYDLIKSKPNSWQSSFEFMEQIGLHLVMTNNAYVWLNRMPSGLIMEMMAFEPGIVSVERKGWASTYSVILEDGTKMPVPNNEMWHIRGPSWNGWQGIDGIRLMREAVGLALALEEHGSRMFGNGSTVGGILSTDQNLTDDQRKALKESWQARQGGLENAYKTAILWGGLKWTPMASPNDQAQFLETRRFQVEEVCRTLKVMPIMVGHSDKTSTYASAEQMFLAHLRNTMGPWLNRLEQSADIKLLTDEERAQGLHTKFSRNAYLSSIARDRAEFYTKMYNIGSLNPNEIRALEDMNPYDGGDEYRVPLNMSEPGQEQDNQDQDQDN